MQFIFSSNDISYDIKKSNVAIYRGSSAIINCVRNGLIPIYFANKEKIEISPIGLNKFSKYVVKNSNDLTKNFNYLNNNKSYLRIKKSILNFFKKKYTPVNKNILKKIENKILNY